jgi:hypothetical protein
MDHVRSAQDVAAAAGAPPLQANKFISDMRSRTSFLIEDILFQPKSQQVSPTFLLFALHTKVSKEFTICLL